MSRRLRVPVLVVGIATAVLLAFLPVERAKAPPREEGSSQAQARQEAEARVENQPADAPAAEAVATGFQDRLVVDAPGATALAFLPDDRLLVAGRDGRLMLRDPGSPTGITQVLDISGRVCSNSERGLLGVAVDPDFQTNGYVYLYYTFKKFGTCPAKQPDQNNPVNRISRFRMAGDAISPEPADEEVLVDNIPSPNGNHNAGDLHFGKDGKLYASTGDGSCNYLSPTRCQPENEASRYRNVLLGKILRLNPNGTIPADNPFPNGVRCGRLMVNNAAGGSAGPRGSICAETYAWGFRNPFRFAMDPDAGGVSLRVNDVGGGRIEEVSQVRSGGDYGWNCREGSLVLNTTPPCPGGEMLRPIHQYNHSTGCSSITGGAFVPNGAGWPSPYRDAYLYGDYVCGKIYSLKPDGSGGFGRTLFASGLQAGPTSFAFGTDGALYYTTYDGGGQVRRVVPTDNQAPVADVAATPSVDGKTYGETPLNVTFDASGSTDDEGDPLTYRWDFGDPGSQDNTATGATAQHAYQTAGRRTATVTVSDDDGDSDTATVDVFAGNAGPPEPVIDPSTPTTFEVDQEIPLSGSATDPDGQGVTLLWEVIRHHTAPNEHTHPSILDPGADDGGSATFTAPGPEDLLSTNPDGNYLEVRLTATDEMGLSRTVSQDLRPETTNVRLATAPRGLYIIVNGERVDAPRTLLAWKRSNLNLYAPPQTQAGKRYVFRNWADGGPNRRTVTTPQNDAQYTARFRVR